MLSVALCGYSIEVRRERLFLQTLFVGATVLTAASLVQTEAFLFVLLYSVY